MSAALPPAFDAWFRSRHPAIPVEGARAVLTLAAEGAGAPFIARYRMERTGGLGLEDVRSIIDAKAAWDRVVNRQAIILDSIRRHATLTPELRQEILATFDPADLEDLYLPYRPKDTRAAAARESGLQPLAEWIWECGHGRQRPEPGQTLELWAFTFRNPEKGVVDAKGAIEGAREILVERLAEARALRARVRRALFDEGWLRAGKTEAAKPHGRYESCFSFHERVSALLEPSGAGRYLLLRRGQAEGELNLFLGAGPDDAGFEGRLLAAFEEAALAVPDSPGAEVLCQAARIALKGHVRSAIEGEVHQALREASDRAAARVFAEGAFRRLMEPALGRRPVLAVEPSRGRLAVAVVDAAGAPVATQVYEPPAQGEGAAHAGIVALASEHAVAALAVADAPTGRDTERPLRAALKEAGIAAPVVLVDSVGAAGWGASEAAQAELPDREPAVRAAVSIARRLQDPRSELLRLPPRALGTGHYPHDVPGAVVQTALETAIESAVHQVGVDLNTAPPVLLARVCGVGPEAAAAIVAHRRANGPFDARRALLDGLLAEKAYEQAAGFLRVHGGTRPLDATGVHPEHHALLEALAARLDKGVEALLGPGAELVQREAALREELGERTFEDVVRELAAAGHDPRGVFVPFAFREDVRRLEDLRPGMVCPGRVSHLTSFGAFVDIGVGQDGLVHVSRLGAGARAAARERPKPGDRLQVRVLRVDVVKRQVSLALSSPPRPSRPVRRRVVHTRPAPPRPAPPLIAGGAGAPAQRRKVLRPKARPAAAPDGARRPAFNNPFAVLAGLKNVSKPRKR